MIKFTKYIPYVVTMIIFSCAASIYFYPVFQGKKLAQSDITQFIGMSKEIKDYRTEYNAEPYWSGAVFSGMPTYQVSAYYPNDYIRKIDRFFRFLPRPADYVFLYFISFFILLLALKVPWKLGVLGALSFGFSTYLIIIFGAGHNSKAHAIAYMPLVLAGVLWVFQKKYLLGFVVTGLAMALEIYTNHLQMTYYLGFCILILGVVKGLEAYQNKIVSQFMKQSAILMLAVVLGIGVNATRIMATKEYSDYSTRGDSELTIHPDGSPKLKVSGLDKDYITQYSYGKLETFNLFIPRFYGGGTTEALQQDSEFYKVLENKVGKKAAINYSKQALTYWGTQPIVEAPAYIGAVVFFLFFLGIFLVKGSLKKWLVAATVFSIMLSWGKNFSVLTDLFIDYVPLYTKFRAVSSIQVIAELCVPLLGILGLKEFFLVKNKAPQKMIALKKAFFITGGAALFFMLFGTSLFAFEGIRDENYLQLPGLVEALIQDRKAMFFKDSLRSFLLITSAAGLLWLLMKQKMQQTTVVIAFVFLIMFDLISVNKRYVNEEDFNIARKIDQPFTASKADKLIMKDTTHYRVANFTRDPMQDGRTSYFHQSIGGYHAAKMMRYKELFEYQIAKNNLDVLNMLNTKYFIVSDEKGVEQVQENQYINGNAWFVNTFVVANSATEEMKALNTLKTNRQVVINKSEFPAVFERSEVLSQKDSTAVIRLQNYDVNSLTYHSNTKKDQFAVFSEIYYEDGWNAYVDGVLTPHARVNYVLRGMIIPEGSHQIVFKFEPKIIQQGNLITLACYGLLLLIPIGWFVAQRKDSLQKNTSLK